jgi:hypothetical protein
MWEIERRYKDHGSRKKHRDLAICYPPCVKVGNESEARWMPGEGDLIKGFTILLICPGNIT